jgi:MFS family permease
MPDEKQIRALLHKRLLPLYISGFFHSFVLWYTIEKLFMQSIGFDNTAIGFMIALYSAVMLVVEVPSGILADRWSRKGVLIGASVCLALSALAGGLSHGISLYLRAAVLWGVFYACYSGIYDTIVYDCIAETAPKSKLFDHLYGRVQLFESIGLVLAGLLGAIIASLIDLRAAYFLSVPLALIPIVALLRFKEPTLHKQHGVISIRKQVTSTLQAITNNRSLFPVIAVLVLRSTLFYCIAEFSQLWLLALHTPTAYYGIASAVLLASLGIGGTLVSHLQLSRYTRMLSVLIVTLLACLGLIFLRTIPGVLLAQSIFTTGLICVYIVFSRILHDNLAASVRAGAASATSTAGRLLIIPMALLIGYVSQKFTIYKAAYIFLALALTMAAFIVFVARRNGRTGLMEED